MMSRLLLIFSLLFVAAPTFWAAPAQAADTGWVVSAAEAKELIDADAATIFDTRGSREWADEHAPGALPIKWQDFSQSKGADRGKLLDDDQRLTKKLQALGVSKDRPVLVVGKPPNNWGEDGRIVWMLRTLGHEKAALVSGGQRALAKAGVEMTTKRPKVEAGDFVVKRTGEFAIERDELRAQYKKKDVVLVDTREKREYDGKTPYGERRGGHVPGAKHLHYSELMGKDGALLPKAKLEEKLQAAGITPDKKVVAYCTGGIRSAWVVAVLADLGYSNVVNYAGSMWDWAAGDVKEFPLE